jgi:hypothetical protein
VIVAAIGVRGNREAEPAHVRLAQATSAIASCLAARHA